MSEGEASFNMSVPTLQRMDLLLQKISVYALSKDFEMWRDCLSHLRRETSCYIKVKQFDKITELLKSLNSFEWIVVDKQGRKKYVEKEIKTVTDILDETTILLEKAMFDGGILMAKKSEDGGFD
jgi:predicted glycosyltransferase